VHVLISIHPNNDTKSQQTYNSMHVSALLFVYQVAQMAGAILINFSLGIIFF